MITLIKWLWNLKLPLLLYEVVVMAITGHMIIHSILPGLYQTSRFTTRDYQTLIDLKIDYIIDLEGTKDSLPPTVKDYYYWPILDEPKLPDLEKLDLVAQWGYEKWKSGGVVMVHCQQGHNRSGLVMGKILILSGMTGKEAVALIQKQVPGGLSNTVFKEYLESL